MKITQPDYLRIIEAGIRTREFEFLTELIHFWKDAFPGDIQSEYYLALIHYLLQEKRISAQINNGVISKDPEFLDALRLLEKVGNFEDKKKAISYIHVIGGETSNFTMVYPWAVTLRAVRTGLKKREIDNSEKLLRNLLVAEPNNQLVAIEHLKLSFLKDDECIIHQLSEDYCKQWPDCIPLLLFNARAKLLIGEEYNAISVLHHCVSLDPMGFVVQRMWGKAHEFNSLWPKSPEIELNVPIPSGIAVSLDWNKLPSGKIKVSSSISEGETLNNIKEMTDHQKVSRKPKRADFLKNAPKNIYVILSSRVGLEKKYGKKTAEVIFNRLVELKEIVNKKKGWEAFVFIPDDPHSTSLSDISPISTIDPWKIKLSLHDLNEALIHSNKKIGAVIIIGGNEIVPFHKLPNPADDSDKEVLSDNPYSTSLGNYLLPEWSVGRLPDENGKDAGLLLEQIRQVIHFHQSNLEKRNIVTNLLNRILKISEIRKLFRGLFKQPRDFGYSTAVWRRSSLASFRPIGKGADLRITPPFDSDTIDINNLMKAKCAYFNLHGLANTPEWYGQRDFSEANNGPDFPIAISVKDLPGISNNIDLVFTEACYGGYVIDKTIDTSLALKLISIGCQGLVGSTCISYGSVFTPLIGADLLAFIFWKYIKEGFSFGDSFLQSKIGFIKVLHQRQGYLDGEDQKSLISFILYGDPLGYLEPDIYIERELVEKIPQRYEINTISDQDGITANNLIFQKTIDHDLNEIIQSYIPSLDNVEVKIREYRIKISKILENKSTQNKSLSGDSDQKKHIQIMYHQKTKAARNIHEQFARVTMNESGKVIKLAVSR